LTDYDKIRQIIDDIIGVDTMQGNNLKEAVKNYFETKPNDIKLVSPQANRIVPFSSNPSSNEDMNKAMQKYTAKLQAESKALKEKGKFKGTCSIDGH